MRENKTVFEAEFIQYAIAPDFFTLLIIYV